ncbi:MAG: hypothetical protein GX631_09810 [Dehalococcoidales bacterium]|nr:hypothetical protein [Dehalococcoidales bacterium]
MTSEIINMLRGTSLVKKSIDLFIEMINADEYLYNEAWRIITVEEKVERIPQYFYDRDIRINNLEKEIRKLILEHLSIRPKYDISGCLALMSLVKDGERIGDYSKNICEAGILHKRAITDLRFYATLVPIQKKIAGNLPILAKAFKSSDEKLAGEILRDYTPLKRECDVVLNGLFDVEMSNNEAVVTAMLSRYLKRINSHVSNIASGIIYPLNEIDFVRGDILE